MQGACSWCEQEVMDWINAQGIMIVAASDNDGSTVVSLRPQIFP
jgi:hypothetical protein